MTPDKIEAISKAVAAELKAATAPVDWSQVELLKPPNPRPQCGKLDDVAWFKLQAIAAKSYEGSMAGVIKTAVMCYLRQKWGHHCEDFQAIAASHELSLEECLSQVVSGELKL